MGAICTRCNRDMLATPGCDHVTYDFEYVLLTALRFGTDDDKADWADKDGRCPDCGCKVGEFHHESCDVEVCPNCGDQMLSCECARGD